MLGLKLNNASKRGPWLQAKLFHFPFDIVSMHDNYHSTTGIVIHSEYVSINSSNTMWNEMDVFIYFACQVPPKVITSVAR